MNVAYRIYGLNIQRRLQCNVRKFQFFMRCKTSLRCTSVNAGAINFKPFLGTVVGI